MAEDIKIRISADANDLEQGLNRAGKSVDKFNTKANTLKKGMTSLNKTTGQGTNATLEFSRVIQDSPFGIQGVANNIQQLTQNFGHLVKSTGSAKNAIKAMIASLSGPAGILLAVSAVTAAMVFYTQSQQKAAKAANDLLDATKDLIGAQQGSLAVITSLLSVAKDENRTIEEKQRALDKVNELTKGYTKSLTIENVATEKSISLTDKLAEAMVRQAKIKGLQATISKLTAERYELENKSIGEQVGFMKTLGERLLGAVKGQTLLQSAATAGNRALVNQEEAIVGIDEAIKKLTGNLSGLVEEDVITKGIFSKSKIKKSSEEFSGEVQNAIKNLNETIAPVVADLSGSLDLIKPEDVDRQIEVMSDARVRMLDELSYFNDAASNIISGGIADTFAGLGEAIGSGLSAGGNVLKSAGGVLLGALGGILVNVGTMAIQTGVALLGIKTALKTLNPAVAIGAGIALVALGSAFKASSAKISDSIGSAGSSFGSSSSSASGSSSRGFSGSTSSSVSGSSGGTVVFEIAGTKLVGVLSNTLGRNRALGGSLTIG